MLVMHCLQASQGLRGTGAGDGDGGVGLGWQVLSSSQPPMPPIQRHTVTVVSLLHSLPLAQSVSSTQVLLLEAPAQSERVGGVQEAEMLHEASGWCKL